jgi:hypothetical protein
MVPRGAVDDLSGGVTMLGSVLPTRATNRATIPGHQRGSFLLDRWPCPATSEGRLVGGVTRQRGTTYRRS